MTTREGLIWGAVILATVAAGVAVPQLEVDNGLERWFAEDSRSEAAYRDFREDFGSDELLMVSLTGDVLGLEALELQLEVHEQVEALAGVAAVRSVAGVWRDLFGAEDVDALAAEVRDSPFFRRLLISADGRTTAMLLSVGTGPAAADRQVLVEAVRSEMRPLAEAGLEPRLVGSTALAAALDEVSVAEVRRVFPLALLGSVVVLALLLRSFRAMIVAVACAGCAVLVTIGLMAGLGRSLDMVTSALPPLVWVLALSNVVHLLRRIQQLDPRETAHDVVTEALMQTRRGCTLAAVTTAAGFASLGVAPMVPVRELGLFAAIGILFSLGLTLGIAPSMSRMLGIASRGEPSREAGRRIAGWAVERSVPVLVVAAVLMVGGLACLPLIERSSNPLGFLPEGHRTVEAYREVGGRVGGFYTLEIVMEPARAWHDPASTEVIDRVARGLERSAVVGRVLSPVDVLRQAARWAGPGPPAGWRLPGDRSARDELLAAVRGREGPGARLLAGLVAGDRVRLSAFVDDMDEQRFLALVDEARGELAELPAGWSADITGQVLGLVEAQQLLVRTQLESLGVALLLVFAVLGIGLRSLRLTVVSVVPNTLPLVALFALMALTSMPLDAGTVMVASIALGIAVDNTAHVLEAVRRQGSQLGGSAAVIAAVAEVGPAMVVTSLTAAAGFAALATSAFVPIADFGILATAALGIALVADGLVLPALVGGRRRS